MFVHRRRLADVSYNYVVICLCVVSRLCLVGRVFFFQAEDGIRDLVRSRGLGDVYKRQAELRALALREALRLYYAGAAGTLAEAFARVWEESVSYTHLTLPTSDLV